MLLLDVYLRIPIFTPTTDVTGCSLHIRQQLTLLNDVTCSGTLINKHNAIAQQMDGSLPDLQLKAAARLNQAPIASASSSMCTKMAA